MDCDYSQKVTSDYEIYKMSSSYVQYVETPGYMDCLEPIFGRSILDVACGAGHYTRLIKNRGAGLTIGTDVSVYQINRATEIEAYHPKDIQYFCQDSRKLWDEFIEKFDTISCAYLTHYMNNLKDLSDALGNLCRYLKKGGKLCILLVDHSPAVYYQATPAKYGFRPGPVVHPQAEYSESQVSFFDSAGNCLSSTPTMHWHDSIIGRILMEVGFSKVTMKTLAVSDEGIKKFGANYWQDFPVVCSKVITAQKI